MGLFYGLPNIYQSFSEPMSLACDLHSVSSCKAPYSSLGETWKLEGVRMSIMTFSMGLEQGSDSIFAPGV